MRRDTAILTHKSLDHPDVDGEAIRVPWRICTGNATVTRDTVRAGLGITGLPEFSVSEDLAMGRLVRLLPGPELPKRPLTVLYQRSIVPSLRNFLNALREWRR